jgi:hypothetical protein
MIASQAIIGGTFSMTRQAIRLGLCPGLSAPQPPVWSADKEREAVPIARDAEWPVPTARRRVAGRSQG